MLFPRSPTSRHARRRAPILPRSFTSSRPARRRALLVTTVALGVGSAAAAPATPASAGANEPRLDTRERAVIHRVNAIRRDHGLPALAFGGKLSRAADRHSARLQRSRTLSHQLPGEASLGQRLASAARVHPIAEVVYHSRRGARSAQIVRSWMDSPTHRAVLLSRDFGRAGVGIRAGSGGVYVTVDVAAS